MKQFIAVIYLLYSLQAPAAESHEPFGWEAVLGAKTYRGTVKESLIGPYRFGTTDTRVLLPGSPKRVFIRALGAKGKKLKHQYATRLSGQILGIATPTQPLEKITVEEAENDEAEPDPEPDDTPFFRNQGSAIGRDVLKATSAKRFYINLGLGKESLDIEGGVSHFKSKSPVGGTQVHFSWAKLGRKMRWYGFSIDAAAHLHSATVEESTDSTASTTKESEHHYFRSYLNAMGRYYLDRFIKSPSQSLSTGLGVASYRTPIMAISDSTTGKSRASMKTVYGPALGLEYRYFFTTKHHAGIDLSYLALGLGDFKKASRLDSWTYYTYMFDRNKGLNAGLTYAQESTEKELSCPAIAACEGTAKTAATTLKYQVGLNVAF